MIDGSNNDAYSLRYPFLDDDVIRMCARVHPRWKLRGVRHDKYLLRLTAARYLPRSLAMRPKLGTRPKSAVA